MYGAVLAINFEKFAVNSTVVELSCASPDVTNTGAVRSVNNNPPIRDLIPSLHPSDLIIQI